MMSTDTQRQLIVDCYGGLGNQLFQYAAWLYFAERSGRQLELGHARAPRGSCAEFTRPFQLDAFSIEAPIRTSSFLDSIYLTDTARRRLLREEFARFSGRQVIREESRNRFFPDLMESTHARTVYLDGYWQSAWYVEQVATTLRRTLRLRQSPGARSLALAEAIGQPASPVSVHLRVGDYAQILLGATSLAGSTPSEPRKKTLVLQPSYYRRVIEELRLQVPNASLVVFTDDPNARQMLAGEDVALWLEGNAHNAYEDLWLMSLCPPDYCEQYVFVVGCLAQCFCRQNGICAEVLGQRPALLLSRHLPGWLDRCR